MPTASSARLWGKCTKEYKIQLVDRAIRRELLEVKHRQRIPNDVVVYQYFGISTDEAGRAGPAKKRFEGIRHTVPLYPLIEMGWSRTDSSDSLRDRLPYETPKSSCVFCPTAPHQPILASFEAKRCVRVEAGG
jgi:hypothetical protein